MRILVTGMGGELGTRVTLLLEGDRRVTDLVGIDVDPPRRRLRRAEFHRVDPRKRDRVVQVVRDLRPTAVVHLGVYEPFARSAPHSAAARTTAGTRAVLDEAVAAGGLERLVVRSGIEVYGRRRGAVSVPDEAVPADPTSPFGRMLRWVEQAAALAGERAGASVALLRFAPLVGPHFPSPLGRYLRLPLVPVSLLADPPFSLLHQEDAARAIVAALFRGVDDTVNVVGAGAVTAAQAALLGSRVPVPVAGLGWIATRQAAALVGAPMPDHVLELLRRGRTADATRAAEVLGSVPTHRTVDVVKALYEWAPVTPLRVAGDTAA